MGEILVNNFDFQSEDIALWGSIEKGLACQNTVEYQEITLDFQVKKEKVREDSCKECDCLKKDITEENQIITDDEESNTKDRFLQCNIESDGKILFEHNGEEYHFNPNNTNEQGIWFSSDLVHLWETTISTENWNFIINEWNIYNWNKAMTSRMNAIDSLHQKRAMSEETSDIIYYSILSKTEPSPISAFTLQNYEKNIHILDSILLLEEAKQSLNDDTKHELLLKSVDEFNLVYDDRLYFSELDDVELEKATDKGLIGILEKGVFVG